MQLKLVALSAALVASVYASPAADVTIPVTDLPIIESVLPSSAKAFILSHGEKSFSQKIASEFSAGKTPGWFTKLPPSIETILVPQNATTAASNSTTTHSHGGHGNHTTTKSHGGHHSKASITTAPGPITITPTPKSTGKTSSSSSSSSTSSTGGAAVASAVFGAGFAGAVGLMGVLAL